MHVYDSSCCSSYLRQKKYFFSCQCHPRDDIFSNNSNTMDRQLTFLCPCFCCHRNGKQLEMAYSTLRYNFLIRICSSGETTTSFPPFCSAIKQYSSWKLREKWFCSKSTANLCQSFMPLSEVLPLNLAALVRWNHIMIMFYFVMCRFDARITTKGCKLMIMK